MLLFYYILYTHNKQNIEIDSPSSCGGQEKYMMLASLDLRLRQQCQFLTVSYF